MHKKAGGIISWKEAGFIFESLSRSYDPEIDDIDSLRSFIAEAINSFAPAVLAIRCRETGITFEPSREEDILCARNASEAVNTADKRRSHKLHQTSVRFARPFDWSFVCAASESDVAIRCVTVLIVYANNAYSLANEDKPLCVLSHCACTKMKRRVILSSSNFSRTNMAKLAEVHVGRTLMLPVGMLTTATRLVLLSF